MKWEKITPPTQHTTDGKYCIVQATQEHWIAYRMGPTTGDEIGKASDEEGARQVCERHATGQWT